MEKIYTRFYTCVIPFAANQAAATPSILFSSPISNCLQVLFQHVQLMLIACFGNKKTQYKMNRVLQSRTILLKMPAIFKHATRKLIAPVHAHSSPSGAWKNYGLC